MIRLFFFLGLVNLFLTLHVNELNRLDCMLIPNFIEHGFEDILVQGQCFCVIIVEIEPDFSSKTYSSWCFRRDKSKSVQFFRHLEVFAHQIKYQSLIDLITLLGSWYLEYQTASVLILWVLPTGFNTLFKKLYRVYTTGLVVHDITR